MTAREGDAQSIIDQVEENRPDRADDEGYQDLVHHLATEYERTGLAPKEFYEDTGREVPPGAKSMLER